MRPGTEKPWVLPALIILGVLCVFFIGGKLGSPASAQVELQTSSDGRVLVVPIQIERDSYGLAMVDMVGQTLWIYQISSRGPVYNRLRLLAARSWRYDKLLQQYNTGEPTPEQVKILLENLGRLRKEQNIQKPQDSDVDVLEIAEPNDRDFGG